MPVPPLSWVWATRPYNLTVPTLVTHSVPLRQEPRRTHSDAESLAGLVTERLRGGGFAAECPACTSPLADASPLPLRHRRMARAGVARYAFAVGFYQAQPHTR